MKKVLIIFLTGIFAILLSQIYWLSNLYDIHKDAFNTAVNEQLEISIKKELTIRPKDEIADIQNPRFVIKAADEMTPEEIASHKGDTIILQAAEKDGIGNNIADIFLQRTQDHILISNPIKLHVLDSIFCSQLEEREIATPFQLLLHNKHKIVTDSTSCEINKKNCIQTALYPIGTQGLLYVSAYVEMPPALILKGMLYAVIVSFLMTLIVLYCLYYQLAVIRRTKYTLQQRETAVYSAIHDLKAPLNTTYTILDFTSLHEKEDLNKEILKAGKVHIRMLTGTIESMLDIIKKKQGISLAITKVDIHELIGQINRELQLLYPDKQYNFNLISQLSIPIVNVDKIRLERCLRNLMENALKYSDNQVQLTITLSEKDRQISIAVQDNGWGIPLKEQKNIGRQFFRANHTDKTARSGYGIGLCSVKLLCREMGGTFTFQSKEGIGSTFFITLPAK